MQPNEIAIVLSFAWLQRYMHAILGYDLHMAKDTYTCCDVKLQVVGLHSLQHNQNWYYSLQSIYISHRSFIWKPDSC